MTKLLEKHNIDIRRATTKYKHTHTAFVEALNKELAKLLFKPMDGQELQGSEKVSTIWVKNWNKTVNEMNDAESLMIGMKPKDAIKLGTVPLNKTFPEETVEDPGNRVLHYLQEGSDRAFVCEELMHFSEDTQVPPDWVSEWK